MPYRSVHRGIAHIALAALLLSPIAFVAPFAQAQDTPTKNTQPSLLVTGIGVATYKPDTAYVSLGVVSRGKEVAPSARENAIKTDRIIKSLIKMGIAVADIRTDNYSVSPDYATRKGQTVMVGYKISNTVTATVRKVGNAGKVIDTALKVGANSVSGVSFGIDDSQKIEDEAVEKAIADATRKAKLSAAAAGLKTIRLIEMQVGDVGSDTGEYQLRITNRYDGGSTPIQGGRQNMTATVTIRFAVVDPTPEIVP